MPKPEQKQCPRCRQLFECKSGSILLCQCQAVMLTPEQLDHVSSRYEDCLCSRCLTELRSEYNGARPPVRNTIQNPSRNDTQPGGRPIPSSGCGDSFQ